MVEHADREADVEGSVLVGDRLSSAVFAVLGPGVSLTSAREHLRRDVDPGQPGNPAFQEAIGLPRPAADVEEAELIRWSHALARQLQQRVGLGAGEEIVVRAREGDRLLDGIAVALAVKVELALGAFGHPEQAKAMALGWAG